MRRIRIRIPDTMKTDMTDDGDGRVNNQHRKANLCGVCSAPVTSWTLHETMLSWVSSHQHYVNVTAFFWGGWGEKNIKMVQDVLLCPFQTNTSAIP